MSFELAPIQTTSLVEAVAARLREAIADGVYQPGERLNERRVSAQLGVSSVATREAIGRLVEQGLVVHRPRRGAFVREVTEDWIRDVAHARIALERLVIDRALERWTPEDTAQLQSIVDTMLDAARRGNEDRLSTCDERFHDRVAAVAGSEVFAELLTHLRHRLEGFLRRTTVELDAEARLASVGWHQALLDALDRGDRDSAYSEIARQVNDGADRAVAHLVSAMPQPGSLP